MKNKKINTIELILLIVMVSGIVYSLFQNEILDNKLFLMLLIIAPFTLVLMIEIIKITNQQESKADNENEQITEEEKESLTKITEKTLEKIEKENPKKEKKQEDTIQIPVEEIKKEIEILNKKLVKNNSDDLEKTEVLFTKGELKEVIKKEIELTKSTKKNNKSTKSVENPKTKQKKSTITVEKSKNKDNKSTEIVEK